VPAVWVAAGVGGQRLLRQRAMPGFMRGERVESAVAGSMSVTIIDSGTRTPIVP